MDPNGSSERDLLGKSLSMCPIFAKVRIVNRSWTCTATTKLRSSIFYPGLMLRFARDSVSIVALSF